MNTKSENHALEIIDLMQDRLLKKTHTIESIRHDFDEIYLSYQESSVIIPTKNSIEGIDTFYFSYPKLKSDKVIIFIHGGGFTLGSTKGHQDFINKLFISTGIPVLSIDYRLSPEHSFPAPIEDCVTVYQHLLLKYKPRNIFFVGMTAGGTIALSSVIALKKQSLPQPKATIVLSPPVDLSFTNSSIATNLGKDWVLGERLLTIQQTYLQGVSPFDPSASPYFADLTELAPLLIQVGSHELLLDDAVKLFAKAKQSKLSAELQIWDKMFHGWHMFSSVLSDGKAAIDKIAEFVKKHVVK